MDKSTKKIVKDVGKTTLIGGGLMAAYEIIKKLFYNKPGTIK